MSDSFSQLRALFEQCADLPAGERTRWLDAHVADTAQRIEIELMLAADAGGDGFLRRDVVSHIGQLSDAQEQEFGPESLVGRRFGAFELERLIGRGGQGAVYLAHRRGGDFEQVAAVKLLRRGLHDSAEHKRFRREREILARFEHAGVARLIDGGVSGEGVPYLVMEYVEGLPIDQWCAQQGLDRPARLRLFVELCEVVAAAQRALIVHRDLKPSNVLVTTEGRIKVLDFGIARLLDEDDASTQTNAPILTPGYGAPEQESGGVITLATDVHALGVLLRVLLTGVTPKRAGAGLQGLPDDLPPELRWIVGKACAAEPERRYRDAAELGEDVMRLLAARPVHAHPPSRWYSVRKFVARHRGGVMTTVAVLLGLLTSFSIALWQAKVAREQAQRAEATRDFLLGIFQAAEEDLPRDARPTPDVLAKAAAQKLENDTRLAPAARADFLTALAAISNSANAHEEALRFAERALRLQESDGTVSRAQLTTEMIRADALTRLGRAAEAESALAPHLQQLRSVIDETTIDGLSSYAMARMATGHQDEGIALTEEAVRAAEAYGRDTNKLLATRLAYGYALQNAGRSPQAVEVLEDTLRRWDASGSAHDHTYGNLLNNLGGTECSLGRFEQCIVRLRQALQARRAIYAAPHEKIANTLRNLGTVLIDRGEYEEAASMLDEATAMYAARFGPAHAQSIVTVTTRAKLDARRGNPAAALAALQRVLGLCDEHGMSKDSSCVYAAHSLAETFLALDRVPEALGAAERSVAMHLALYGGQHPEYATALVPLADAQLRGKDPRAAMVTLERALAIFQARGQAQTLGAANALRLKAATLHAMQHDEEALAALLAARPIVDGLASRNQSRRFPLIALQAEVLSALHRDIEARSAAREALTLTEAVAAAKAGHRQALEAIAR